MRSKIASKKYAEGEQYMTPESEEREFHRQMHENPEDRTTPLVYADWLDEHDRPGLARVIRETIKKQTEPGGNWRRAIEAYHHAEHANPQQANWSSISYLTPESQKNFGNANDLIFVTHLSKHDPKQVFQWSSWIPHKESKSVVEQLRKEGFPLAGLDPGVPRHHVDRSETATAKRMFPEGPNPQPTPTQEYSRKSQLKVKKLARTEDMVQHEKDVIKNPHEATGWLSLADHYDENGEPGGDILREYAKLVQNGETREGRHLYHGMMPELRGWMGHPNNFSNLWRNHWDRNYTDHANQDPRFAIRSLKRDIPAPAIVLSMNAHHGGLVHVPVTPSNVDKLANSMGEDGKILRNVVAKHFGDTKKPLQRKSPLKVKKYNRETEMAGFHQAMHKNPDEASNALAYADWLEENGYPEAAEIIKLHVQQNGTGAFGTPFAPGSPKEESGDFSQSRNGHFSVHGGFHPPKEPGGKSYWAITLAQRTGLHPRYPNTGGLEWVAEIPDEATGERLARGIFAKGGSPQGGSYWQDTYKGRMGYYTSPKERIPYVTEPQQMQRRKYGAYRAPAGGIVARGTYYKGGETIPDMKGEFMNPPDKLSKEEKVHKVNKAPVNFRGLAKVRKRIQENRGKKTKVPGVRHLPDVLPGQESFPGS